MNAKRRELKSLISNAVFKVVLFENQVTIRNIKMAKRKLKKDW